MEIRAYRGRITYTLLAELECALVEALGEELHCTTLEGSETRNFTDDIACELHLDSELSEKGCVVLRLRIGLTITAANYGDSRTRPAPEGVCGMLIKGICYDMRIR